MAKIVLISRNLPPLTGGMERLSEQLVLALADRYQCEVIGPPGAAKYLPKSVTVRECASPAAGRFLLGALARSLRTAARRPNLIIATSGVTAPLARALAILTRRPYLVLIHGLDVVAPQWLYRRVFWPAARDADQIVANSNNTRKLAIEHHAPPSRIEIVHPGVSWPTTLPPRERFRERHGFGNAPLLVSVGRFATRKGLPEFIEHALPLIIERLPDTQLAIIGDEARDAIRREDSVARRIERAVERSKTSAAVTLLGELDAEQLGEAYASADCHVFPLIPVPGDVEGFGMVAAEAASYGLWTAAFDEGGVRDAVLDTLTGTLVPGGDYAGLSAAILAALTKSSDRTRQARCREAARRFEWSRFDTQMRALVDRNLQCPAHG